MKTLTAALVALSIGAGACSKTRGNATGNPGGASGSVVSNGGDAGGLMAAGGIGGVGAAGALDAGAECQSYLSALWPVHRGRPRWNLSSRF